MGEGFGHRDRCAITGIGTTDFSRRSGRSELTLALQASVAALDDAGLTPGDVDGIVRCDHDFVRHNVAAPQQDQQPGHADDIARVEAWLSAFPDLQVAIENLYASSDTVVSWQVWTGTQDGPLMQWGAPEKGLPMARE